MQDNTPRGAIQDHLQARRRRPEDLEEEKEDPRREREGRDRKKRDRKDAHKHDRREDRERDWERDREYQLACRPTGLRRNLTHGGQPTQGTLC